jgi:hypothetical protein
MQFNTEPYRADFLPSEQYTRFKHNVNLTHTATNQPLL